MIRKPGRMSYRFVIRKVKKKKTYNFDDCYRRMVLQLDYPLILHNKPFSPSSHRNPPTLNVQVIRKTIHFAAVKVNLFCRPRFVGSLHSL
jgi:hypothetical protein